MTLSRATVSSTPVVDEIVGHEFEAGIADKLHELRHRHAVEYVHLDATDLDRRRLRVTSDAGRDYAVVLDRHKRLVDGAVLVLGESRAVVVRAGAPRTLRLRASTIPSAMHLGFLAGHLHWKATMTGTTMTVVLEGPESDYRARIAELLDDGTVEHLEE
ncbi:MULTISPECIES: urease accessory protein UreE [Nocardiaceae]|uniref:urease accessory protein UreE n=1 Tax=Nocardiaceae TaxID=85025 RepID=UPI000692128C|nr:MULTISPECIES: urease accessory protein UreE [Rhodococcus]OZE96273.1 urease accessory protein UreE [Rhodococcus sp. 15-1189-1-1a]OZF10818.1 urease accessory protein UreE [Rhodococcus sp. 14-2686-1-2]